MQYSFHGIKGKCCLFHFCRVLLFDFSEYASLYCNLIKACVRYFLSNVYFFTK